MNKEQYKKLIESIESNEWLLGCMNNPSHNMKDWHVETIREVLIERGGLIHETS